MAKNAKKRAITKCKNCKEVSSGSYIDLIEIDAASNRGIDDIRELKDKIKLAPSSGTTKIYIIDEVHMLTPEAFNALLKTLEEPPAHAVFILCTTELHKVPDTIKSRCQLFKFKRATKSQLIEKLRSISTSEGVTHLSEDDLGKIAEASFGGFRDAETLLQQVVEGNLDASAFVGLSSKQTYVDFVEYLLTSDTNEALHILNKLDDDGVDFHVWSFGLLSYLRDLLFIKVDAHEGLIDVSEELFKSIKTQSGKTDVTFISRCLNAFLEASNQIGSSVIPQLPLELAIINVSAGVSVSNSSEEEVIDGPQANSVDTVATLKNSKGKKKNKKTVSKSKKAVVETTKITKTKVELTEDEELAELSKMFAADEVDSVEEKPQVTNETKPDSVVALSSVSDQWGSVVKESVQFNNSIHALLKSSEPIDIVGNKLYIEVSYKFHKDRLESPKNRKIVEGVLKTVVGEDLSLYCKINPNKRPKKSLADNEVGELTDQNIVPAMLSGVDNPDNVLDFFDGGLPM